VLVVPSVEATDVSNKPIRIGKRKYTKMNLRQALMRAKLQQLADAECRLRRYSTANIVEMLRIELRLKETVSWQVMT